VMIYLGTRANATTGFKILEGFGPKISTAV
jgi:hypothetical protein